MKSSKNYTEISDKDENKNKKNDEVTVTESEMAQCTNNKRVQLLYLGFQHVNTFSKTTSNSTVKQ